MPQPIVQIQTGKIQGQWLANNSIASFKGIPYAQAPIGNLRWKAPQAPSSWDGIRKTTKFSASAWQQEVNLPAFLGAVINGQGWSGLHTFLINSLLKIAPKPKQSEDCLYLNIKSPSLDATSKLPVMVWIHGGDHQDGGAAEPFYDGIAIPKKDVVLVTINYRLGLFGYFAHPDLKKETEQQVAGNYGTLDQIAALKWVQENISAFGGDPNNVTIFGESAGGESVAHLLTSPLAKGLFHRAILQSPANAGQMVRLSEPFGYLPSAEDWSMQFAQAMGVKGINQIEQLRGMDAKELMKRLRKEPLLNTFYPNIDGYVLPKSPLEAFWDNDYNHVPILLGSNADEGTCIYPIFEVPVVDYNLLDLPKDKLPDFFYEDFPGAAQLIKLYPGLEKRDPQAETDFLGDQFFGSKVRFYADCAAKHGNVAFFYHFKRVPPSAKQTVGAFHAAEISFVHGTNTPVLPLNAQDRGLSNTMINYWTNFAKNGDPNSSDCPSWPAFDCTKPEWMIFDIAKVQMEAIDRDKKYELLNKRTEAQIEAMKALLKNA